MNEKHKMSILLLLIIFCILLLLVIFSVRYITVEESPDRFAIVIFSPENSTQIVFTCEIAQSSEEKSQGLMFRQDLQDDCGMLFVYETQQNLSYWMKNTLIPLDIIFVDKTGIVINIESADVESNISGIDIKRYNSTSPVMFVVEINQGLSGLYRITKGTPVLIEYV